MESLAAVMAFYSRLHDYSVVERYLEEFEKTLAGSGLERHYLGAYTDVYRGPVPRVSVVFVATGGVSGTVYESVRGSERVYIVYHDEHNSLASALNTASLLGLSGVSTRLLSLEELRTIGPRLGRALEALGRLYGKRVLVVGGLPRWLVSMGGLEKVSRQFGVSIDVVGLEALEEIYREVDTGSATEVAEALARGSSGVEVGREDLVKASRAYLALAELSRRRGLDTVAVRCFDMIERMGFTGCVALEEFMARGGVAGCEGDIHATIVARILRELSGTDPWLGNVSYVGPGLLELSHCMISRRAVKTYRLVTHFESGLPVSIEGVVEEGARATIAAYSSLKRVWRVLEAEVVRGRPVSNRKCRTQVLFRVSQEGSRAVLRDPIEGHYVAVFRDVVEETALVGELVGLETQVYRL